MCRRWIEIKTSGDFQEEDSENKHRVISEEFDRYDLVDWEDDEACLFTSVLLKLT